jgi:hypothetical protein
LKHLLLASAFICGALAQQGDTAKDRGATPALIRGRVFDATTNEPVPGAEIRGFYAKSPVLARSDAEGNFEFVDIDNGLFRFRASKDGYGPGGQEAYWERIPREAKLETLPNGSRIFSFVTIPLLKLAILNGMSWTIPGTRSPKRGCTWIQFPRTYRRGTFSLILRLGKATKAT